jgi:hypothetical protein
MVRARLSPLFAALTLLVAVSTAEDVVGQAGPSAPPRHAVSQPGIVHPATAQRTASQSPGKSARRPKRVARTKKVPAWPNYETRRADFLRRLNDANATGQPTPDPLLQYLVSEVVATGLVGTEEDVRVFLLALPSGNTFVASPGTRLYNGTLEEIVVGRSGYLEEVRVIFAELKSARSGGTQLMTKLVQEPPAKPEQSLPTAAPPVRVEGPPAEQGSGESTTRTDGGTQPPSGEKSTSLPSTPTPNP